jgi:hypothetical protein
MHTTFRSRIHNGRDHLADVAIFQVVPYFHFWDYNLYYFPRHPDACVDTEMRTVLKDEEKVKITIHEKRRRANSGASLLHLTPRQWERQQEMGTRDVCCMKADTQTVCTCVLLATTLFKCIKCSIWHTNSQPVSATAAVLAYLRATTIPFCVMASRTEDRKKNCNEQDRINAVISSQDLQ